MAIQNPKLFNVRIKNKYDSYEKWASSGLVLEAGEIAIAYTTVDVKVDNGTAKHPALLMKVGDGEKTFADLPWLSARAADVLSVCKDETELKAFVNQLINAADLTTSNEFMKALANRVTTVENDLNTETTGLKARVTTAEQAIDALEALVGDKEVSVQIEEAIAALKLDETYDAKGSAKAVQDNLDAFELIVNAAIGTADSEGSILAAAKAHANGLDTAMDLRVDALEAKFGEGEGTVEKQISDAIAAEASARDTAIENAIKAEASARDTAIEAAVKAEKERAEGVESGLNTRLADVEKDYLKAADKTELQGNIDTVSGKVATLIGEDADKSVRTIANEELAKQLIEEGAAESLDTLQEIAAWIQDHPGDAAAMNKAIEDLTALVGTLPEGVTATTVVGLVQELVKAEEDRAKGVESGLNTRLEAVEASVGEVGSVATAISTAKQEAIEAAATDATTKANNAESNAKAHAETKVTELANGAVAGNTAAIAVLNGDAQTEGSVAKAVADAEARAAQDAQDKVDALANGAVKANTEAIAAINNAETGILAQAKTHVADEIAKLDAEVEVSSDKHVVTGVTEVDGKLTAVKEVELSNIAFTGSTDDLIQGTMTLVFDCGNATA